MSDTVSAVYIGGPRDGRRQIVHTSFGDGYMFPVQISEDMAALQSFYEPPKVVKFRTHYYRLSKIGAPEGASWALVWGENKPNLHRLIETLLSGYRQQPRGQEARQGDMGE